MIQIQTQKAEYWGAEFSVIDSDIEQLYNHLLESEKSQTIDQLVRILFDFRIKQDLNAIERLKKGRIVYDPGLKFGIGEKFYRRSRRLVVEAHLKRHQKIPNCGRVIVFAVYLFHFPEESDQHVT